VYRHLYFFIFVVVSVPSYGAGPDIDAVLSSGQFDRAIAELDVHLKLQPKDDVLVLD